MCIFLHHIIFKKRAWSYYRIFFTYNCNSSYLFIYPSACLYVSFCSVYLYIYLSKDIKKDKNLKIILKSKLRTLGVTAFPI